MRCLRVIFEPGVDVFLANGQLLLKMPNQPGAGLPPEAVREIAVKTSNLTEAEPKVSRSLLLAPGYTVGPHFDGEDSEIRSFLFEKYYSFGINGQRDTFFFIPISYIRTLEEEEAP